MNEPRTGEGMHGQQTFRQRMLHAVLTGAAALTLAMLIAPLLAGTTTGFATAAVAALLGAAGIVLALRAAWEALAADTAAADQEIARLRGALAAANCGVRALAPAAAAEDRTQFLATLAHELRNPLNPLRSAAQILRVKGTRDPEVAWAQGVIERQVSQMARLLDDLLDASHATRGELHLQRERVKLGEVVELAVGTSRAQLDAGRHRLEIALPEEPIEIEADALRLAQALANLLDNAATYSPAGTRIVLAARREPAAVAITVGDSGIGIESARLPRLFEPFWQAEPGGHRAQGGLGLGLTMVRALVELHGGTVTAHSAGTGLGSEFTIRLPLAPSAAPVVADGVDAPPAPRRVLVVDDNRDGAEGLALLLRLRGYEARTAADGPSALAAAREFAPDVVLLDIGLPGLSGYEVARRLRAQPNGERVLIFALTGWGQAEDKRRAAEAGCDDHYTKPYDPDLLLARIVRPRAAVRAGRQTEPRRAAAVH